MAQSQLADAQPEEQGETTTTTGKRPTVLYDNLHGTQVKRWDNIGKNGEFSTVAIERSYKREGDKDFTVQKVSLNADELLAVARALEKGHDQIVEKNLPKGQQR